MIDLEIEIFHTQPDAFHGSQSAAVHQLAHQFGRSAHCFQQGRYFFSTHDRGQPFRPLGPDGVDRIIDSNSQHMPVEEQDRIKRLVLGRCRNPAIDGQMRQKGFDFSGAHFGRMPLPMKEDEPFDPGSVSAFRTERVMLEAQLLSDLVEQLLLRAMHQFCLHLGLVSSIL